MDADAWFIHAAVANYAHVVHKRINHTLHKNHAACQTVGRAVWRLFYPLTHVRVGRTGGKLDDRIRTYVLRRPRPFLFLPDLVRPSSVCLSVQPALTPSVRPRPSASRRPKPAHAAASGRPAYLQLQAEIGGRYLSLVRCFQPANSS